MLGNFSCVLSSADLKKNLSGSNSLDPDQARQKCRA